MSVVTQRRYSRPTHSLTHSPTHTHTHTHTYSLMYKTTHETIKTDMMSPHQFLVHRLIESVHRVQEAIVTYDIMLTQS